MPIEQSWSRFAINCWDHVGPATCPALAGNMEPCSTSCHGLVTSTNICHFSEKSNSNWFESCLHSPTVVTRLRDDHESRECWGRAVGHGPHVWHLCLHICLFCWQWSDTTPSRPPSPQLWPCVMTVTTVVLVWWEKLELTFVPKTLIFLNPLFGALPKIRDWIQKYVQIHNGLLFLKWCETSQSVQWFGC